MMLIAQRTDTAGYHGLVYAVSATALSLTFKKKTHTFVKIFAYPSHRKSPQDVAMRYDENIAELSGWVVGGLADGLFVKAGAKILNQTVKPGRNVGGRSVVIEVRYDDNRRVQLGYST